jgi:Uncharacterised nucleotidyltransferase
LPETILGQLKLPEAHSEKPWQSFDEREWDRSLAWLDQGGLALYFRHHLKRTNGMDVMPDYVRAKLDRRSADNQLRVADTVRELKTLSEAFATAGIRYAFLKGIALTPDYCPDPAVRTQYDHDVLVDPAFLEGAEGVLRKAGYRRKHTAEKQYVVYCPPEPEVRFSENSEARYSPMLGRCIELHLMLWESAEEKIDINLPQDFLQRSTLRRWQDVEYVALCDEDCLLFQILHAFRHILRNWCRLSTFLEIAYFLEQRASDRVFWNGFADRIENLRWVPEASLVVFSLARDLFGASIPQQIQGRLTTRLSPALNLWIQTFGRRSARSNFNGDKCSLFLHREFVEDPVEWTNIRRRRLFPVRRPHRPPAIVFQRGFSYTGRLWMENIHALRRLWFHAAAGLRYAYEYPVWTFRRARLAGSAGA